jgi:hypothetical protein
MKQAAISSQAIVRSNYDAAAADSEQKPKKDGSKRRKLHGSEAAHFLAWHSAKTNVEQGTASLRRRLRNAWRQTKETD